MAAEFDAVYAIATGASPHARGQLSALRQVEAAVKACRAVCEPGAPALLKAGVEACLAARVGPAGPIADTPLGRALAGYDLVPCKDLKALARTLLAGQQPAVTPESLAAVEAAASARTFPRDPDGEGLATRLEELGAVVTKSWGLAAYRVGGCQFSTSDEAVAAVAEQSGLLEVWAGAGWALSCVQPLGFLACPPDAPPRRVWCPVEGVPCKKWSAVAKAYL